MTKKWFKHRTFSVHEEEGVGADTGTHQKKALPDDLSRKPHQNKIFVYIYSYIFALVSYILSSYFLSGV